MVKCSRPLCLPSLCVCMTTETGTSHFSPFIPFSFHSVFFRPLSSSLISGVEKRQLGWAFGPPKRIFGVSLFYPLGVILPFLKILFLNPDYLFPAHLFSRYLFYLSMLKRSQYCGRSRMSYPLLEKPERRQRIAKADKKDIDWNIGVKTIPRRVLTRTSGANLFLWETFERRTGRNQRVQTMNVRRKKK